MSKLRLWIAAGAMALAFGAITAGPAQAGWIVSGTALAGSASIASASTTGKVVLKFSTIEIECTSSALGGQISQPAKITASSLEFAGCSVVKPTTCTLENTSIATLPVEGEVTLDGPLATKSKVRAENVTELLATFKLNGTSCGSSGKNTVTGTFGELSPEGQDELLSHAVNLQIQTAGELKVGSAEATISGNTPICLENEIPWRFS